MSGTRRAERPQDCLKESGNRSYSILTEANAIGCGFSVDPKRHPRENNEESTRNIDLDQKVAHVSM